MVSVRAKAPWMHILIDLVGFASQILPRNAYGLPVTARRTPWSGGVLECLGH
jgi:hypothetical protein